MVLEISTAVGCAMHCSYCPEATAQARYSGPRLLTPETYATALRNAPAGCLVSFAGLAEPYLNSDCSTLLGMTADAGHPLQVYTTAVGMSGRDLAALIACRPTFVTLHLPDAEGRMRYTPTPAYVEVVRGLLASGLDVRFSLFGDVHPALVPVVGSFPGGIPNSRAGNVTHLPQVRKSGPLKCGPAPDLDHPVMLPDGRLILCCSDWSIEYVVGDLTRQTWAEIAAGPALADVRRRMAAGDPSLICSRCEYAKCA